MRRIRLLLLTVTALLVVGVGLLVTRALDSIQSGESMRHQIIADRMFDGMEEELSDLIESEEARSFLEYRFFYAPEGAEAEALTRSPLSRRPSEDWIVGYFQLEPDGSLISPRRPRDAERAVTTYGWSDSDELQREEDQLGELTEGLRKQMAARWENLLDEGIVEADTVEEVTRRQPDPAPTTTKAPAPKPSKEDLLAEKKNLLKKEEAAKKKAEPTPAPRSQKAVLDTLNRGASKRADRSTKSEPVSTDNAYFQLPKDQWEEPEPEVVDAELPEVEAPQDLESEVQSLPPRQAKRSSSRRRSAPPKFPAPRLGAQKSAPAAEEVPQEVWADEEGEAADFEDDRERQEEASEGEDDARAEEQEEDPALAQREAAQGFEPAEEVAAESNEQVAATAAPAADDLASATVDPSTELVAAAGAALAEEAPTQAVVVEPEPTPAPVRKPKPRRVVQAPPPPPEPRSEPEMTLVGAVEAAGRASEFVDVRISPLRGLRVDGQHLLLHRAVRVGELTWRQGLVLKIPDLIDHLQTSVLEQKLAGFVDLRWDVPNSHGPAEVTPLDRFRFGHQFAAPFTSLAATATLRKLPQEGRDPAQWVLLLSVLLGVVGVVGFLALYRMVSVVVAFAERRNNFVAAVTHELKTPLTAIRMYGEMLREGMVPSDDKRQEYYGTITAESERLSRLIDNVLELSRLEKGTRSVHATLGPIGPVLDEVVRVLRPHAKKMGFALELEVAPDVPTATFDSDALQQVLINLVDNALKFARNADDKVVTIACERVGDEVVLRVRDRGPGVPAVQVGKVFQPFFRGERELTRSTKGTGIGLALVHGLVEQMGGRVIARNHPKGGFEVSIALAPSPA